MGLAASGCSLLEHELGPIGHGGPDAGELVARRFRMAPRARSTVCFSSSRSRLHLPDIQEVGTQHGDQHGMGLANGLLPGAASTPGGMISARGSITGVT